MWSDVRNFEKIMEEKVCGINNAPKDVSVT